MELNPFTFYLYVLGQFHGVCWANINICHYCRRSRNC